MTDKNRTPVRLSTVIWIENQEWILKVMKTENRANVSDALRLILRRDKERECSTK